MSSEEEKIVPPAAAPAETPAEEEKPKSDKKVKEKAPKSPKSGKKPKKFETDAAPEAGTAAEEKHEEKNGVEEEKPAVVAEEKPAAEPASPKDDKEAADAAKKDKKDKKDKKEKKDSPKEEVAAAPVEDKKEGEKAAAPAVRGRSNSKSVLKTSQQIEEEADTAESIRIWHHPGNVRSSRVLWLLKEMEGTVAEHLKVSIQLHKDKREAFTAINPTGDVPTLRFGNPGFCLFEPGTHSAHTYTLYLVCLFLARRAVSLPFPFCAHCYSYPFPNPPLLVYCFGLFDISE